MHQPVRAPRPSPGLQNGDGDGIPIQIPTISSKKSTGRSRSLTMEDPSFAANQFAIARGAAIHHSRSINGDRGNHFLTFEPTAASLCGKRARAGNLSQDVELSSWQAPPG